MPRVDVARHDQVAGQLAVGCVGAEAEGARLRQLGDEHRARPRCRVRLALDALDVLEVDPPRAAEARGSREHPVGVGCAHVDRRDLVGGPEPGGEPAWKRARGRWRVVGVRRHRRTPRLEQLAIATAPSPTQTAPTGSSSSSGRERPRPGDEDLAALGVDERRRAGRSGSRGRRASRHRPRAGRARARARARPRARSACR